MFVSLTTGLIHYLEEEFSLSGSLAATLGLVTVILLLSSIIWANRELLIEGVRHYRVSSDGVELNSVFHPWSKYQHFSDSYTFIKKASPSILIDNQPERYNITLLKKRFSDKGKLIILMDNRDIYEKVLEIVRKNLKSNI
jgi:hypothetical protein